MINCSFFNQRIHTLIFLFILLLPLNLWADCQATLQWDPNSEPNVYYQLYLREIGNSYDYNNFDWQGSGTQTTIGQLDESKTYFFVVRATDAQGNQSGDSNEVVFKYGSSIDNSSGLSSSVAAGGGSGGGGGCFILNLLYP